MSASRSCGCPQVDALLEKAEGLAAAGRLDDARSAYLVAVENDSGHKARNEFGLFLARLERYAEALDQFSQLLAAAKKVGNHRLRATACHNLAAVYRELGRSDIAARLQQQAISAVCSAGDSFEVSSSDLSNRANDAILAGKLYLAQCLLRRSLTLEVANGSLEGQAADWGSLGIVAGLKGDFAESIDLLWSAYNLHRRLHDAGGEGRDLMNLAEILGRIGRRRAACRCLRRAANRFEQAHAPKSARLARLRLEETARIAELLFRDPSLN